MDRHRIVFLGSGNVATHLARALDSVHDVVQVYSPTLDHAASLARSLSCATATDRLDTVVSDADFYIISVKDDAVAQVAAGLPEVAGVVVHTSGSVNIDAISRDQGRYGVMYPLQTFSRNAQVDVSEVPFFIEASDDDTLSLIKGLALSMSGSVYVADSRQRTVLHVAAVFGCNFVNHLLDISSQILDENGYSLEVLRPLLSATIDKAMDIGPHLAQTGPAARNDRSIISKHIASLSPDRAAIYEILTEHIINNR